MQKRLGAVVEELAPQKVIIIRDPHVGLEAVVVVDNTACGPAIGGVRMATDVGIGEVARLARAMTLKNAASGLPYGGGKAGIAADPGLDPPKKEALIRSFARAIRDLHEYIPGPDMGTDEMCMAWVHDEINRAVGIPRVLGGIPLDVIGATGLGLAVCAEVAQEYCGIALKGARVAIQGFGAVGQHAARFLEERGAVTVAVADSQGGVFNSSGLRLADLLEFKAGGSSVHSFPQGQPITSDNFVGVDCDIWIPAARPDVLTAANVSLLKARLVLPGANIPATPQAEDFLHRHGVLSVPDFIANAGGVICASVEHSGGTEGQALSTIAEKVRQSTGAVLERSRQSGQNPRAAAEEIAWARVKEAEGYRRR
jgi:glutamate dehydrogenase/leucine dehydrogenase